MQISATRPEMLNPASPAPPRGSAAGNALPLGDRAPIEDGPPQTAGSQTVSIDDFMAAWGSDQAAFDIDGSGIVDGSDLGQFLAAQTAAATGDAELQSLLNAWGTADPAWDLNGDGVVNGVDLGIHLQGIGDPVEAEDGGAMELTVEGFAQAWGSADPNYDLNGDGLVDGADLGAFLNQHGGEVPEPSTIDRFMAAWGSDDPEFDFNGDGIVDGIDLGRLLDGGGSDPIGRQPMNGTERLDEVANKLLAATMDGLDEDGDGLLSLASLGIFGPGAAGFDGDGDGLIDRNELQSLIRSRLEGFLDAQGLVDEPGLGGFMFNWSQLLGTSGLQIDPIGEANLRRGFNQLSAQVDSATLAAANRVEGTLARLGQTSTPSNMAEILKAIPLPGTNSDAVLHQLLSRHPIGGVETIA